MSNAALNWAWAQPVKELHAEEVLELLEGTYRKGGIQTEGA